MSADRYMTSVEAMEYIGGFKSLKSFLNMLSKRRRAGRPITTRRINGRLRFRVSDLEAAMTVERQRGARG